MADDIFLLRPPATVPITWRLTRGGALFCSKRGCLVHPNCKPRGLFPHPSLCFIGCCCCHRLRYLFPRFISTQEHCDNATQLLAYLSVAGMSDIVFQGFFPAFPPSFLSFLSFFPPFSISRCPAFSARSFSVCAVKPEVDFFFSLFCAMSFCFFGLITRFPR